MSTFVKDRLEDSCGQFNIIKNIKNLSLVILDDTISNIPPEYKDFKFIPGKRLILSENDTKEEKISYPKGSFIERLESVKVKNVLNERYISVLQSLRDNSAAIEQMTAELLDIEVITGERVREIIKENGGKVFEDEDLHSDSVKHTEVSNEENQEN